MTYDPERSLAVSYAPRDRRDGLAALLALDDTLGQILRTTREPLVGQMRLTWWHDALSALDAAPPPAQPVLQALAAKVLPRGVTGARLARMIEGWEVLLDPEPLDRARLGAYAAGRGSRLFELAGDVLGAPSDDRLEFAGAGWALADFAAHVRDDAIATLARAMAREALGVAAHGGWSRAARALGALALSARMDLASARAPGSPSRVARLAWHRVSGR